MILTHILILLSQLCLQHRQVFLAEQVLFTPKKLSLHMECGDEKLGVKHAKCQFCQDWMYDSEQYWLHVYALHCVCNICQNNGTENCIFNSEIEYVS